MEPTSKLDSLRVLADLGIKDLSKDRLYRCLQKLLKKITVKPSANFVLTTRPAKNLNLVLYDVEPLYILKSRREDSYRKPGLSKERRLEPQIVIGLLVDQSGFPLAGLPKF